MAGIDWTVGMPIIYTSLARLGGQGVKYYGEVIKVTPAGYVHVSYYDEAHKRHREAGIKFGPISKSRVPSLGEHLGKDGWKTSWDRTIYPDTPENRTKFKLKAREKVVPA